MSSDGYAAALSYYPNKGVCGLPELYDTPRALNRKLGQLQELFESAKHVVVLTGAGISTSAGIPDFRGPNGIWTLEQKEEKRKRKRQTTTTPPRKVSRATKKRRRRKHPQQEEQQKEEEDGGQDKDMEDSNRNVQDGTDMEDSKTDNTGKEPKVDEEEKKEDLVRHDTQSESQRSSTSPSSSSTCPSSPSSKTTTTTTTTSSTSAPLPSFESAKPTLTHHAITRLVHLQKVQYVVTQNVDGLHQRSGLSRDSLAVLHGCVFTEECEKCRARYFRDFYVGTISFSKTGRYCTQCRCGGALRDTVLDWDDALPQEDWDRAQEECARADLVLCLGTSLRIEPAGDLPLRAKRMVIVNLQVTPHDDKAALVLRAKVDTVLSNLLDRLEISLEAPADKNPNLLEDAANETSHNKEATTTVTRSAAN